MLDARDLSQRLAARALDVCRTYLSNGRREGRYWLVGDIHNTPGRSLYVRLVGPASGQGAAGKWTDAATGDHGDLLDLIRLSTGVVTYRDLHDEVLRFLALPVPAMLAPSMASPNSTVTAQKLFAAGRPVPGTLAEAYLRGRGITCALDWECLRFHPTVYSRSPNGQRTTWPAMLAAVTDLSGTITGIMRTYLDPDTAGKAPLHQPRRALGSLLGHGIRFGHAGDVLMVGEGIETMLSLKSLHPDVPMLAATSAAHLAGVLLPPSLKRLIIAPDNDTAGLAAAEQLTARVMGDVDVSLLIPPLDDWNASLAVGPFVTSLLHPNT